MIRYSNGGKICIHFQVLQNGSIKSGVPRPTKDFSEDTSYRGGFMAAAALLHYFLKFI